MFEEVLSIKMSVMVTVLLLCESRLNFDLKRGEQSNLFLGSTKLSEKEKQRFNSTFVHHQSFECVAVDHNIQKRASQNLTKMHYLRLAEINMVQYFWAKE